MSSLEVVLKTVELNLSFTLNMFFFSFTTSTTEFSKGTNDTFRSDYPQQYRSP
jgi:hypothetical protein